MEFNIDQTIQTPLCHEIINLMPNNTLDAHTSKMNEINDLSRLPAVQKIKTECSKHKNLFNTALIKSENASENADDLIIKLEPEIDEFEFKNFPLDNLLSTEERIKHEPKLELLKVFEKDEKCIVENQHQIFNTALVPHEDPLSEQNNPLKIETSVKCEKMLDNVYGQWEIKNEDLEIKEEIEDLDLNETGMISGGMAQNHPSLLSCYTEKPKQVIQSLRDSPIICSSAFNDGNFSLNVKKNDLSENSAILNQFNTNLDNRENATINTLSTEEDFDKVSPKAIKQDERKNDEPNRHKILFNLEAKKIENSNRKIEMPMSNKESCSSEEDIFAAEMDNTKKGTKRKRKRYLRSKEERQKVLQNNKIAAKYSVKPPCKCSKKCFEQIAENRRLKINETFWKMKFGERKLFISNSCQESEIKKKEKKSKNHTREINRKYYFADGTITEVCKVFFLTTLGYSAQNDSVLRSMSVRDKRGSYRRNDKINIETVKEHIMTFTPCISHYQREHAPRKMYLPSDISINDMFNNFKIKYPQVRCSYEYYRKTVTNVMNISFSKLGCEECERCEAYNLHKDQHEQNLEETLCENCEEWNRHIKNANIARDEYGKDATININETLCVSVDMQKVIMLPRLDMFKEVIFTPRIMAFNQSFVPVGKENKVGPFAALWHEGISGRNDEDIVSAYYKFLTTTARNFDPIIIWADNRASQNKNWCLFSFLVYIINSGQISASTITIKYFETGHTLMAADRFHHLVEKSLRKKQNVYDFNDFLDAVRESSKNIVPAVEEMQFEDFSLWPRLTPNYQLQKLNNEKQLIQNITIITARKGAKNLFYQESFGGTEKERHFLPTEYFGPVEAILEEPRSLEKNRGITQRRKETILKSLGKLMPPHKLKFWENLDCSTERDLDVGEI